MSEKSATGTTEQALRLGIQHHESGRLPEAESVYQQILNKHPEQPVALHMMGLIAHQVGKNHVALDLMTQAIAILPDYSAAHHNLGQVQQALGRPYEAVECYRRSIAIKGDYAPTHSNLGIALLEIGNVQEAILSHRNALDLQPESAEAHLSFGATLQEVGKVGEAITMYQKALQIKPVFAMAHNNLANSLRELGNFEAAVTSYQNALGIDPQLAMAHDNLGLVLEDLDRLEEAADSYQNGLRLAPNNSKGHCNLGNVFKRLRKYEEACKSFRRALDLVPAPSSARTALLECAFLIGDRDSFYKELDKVIAVDPINPGVAAISAWASSQFSLPDPYPFCSTPRDFISVNKITPNDKKTVSLIERLKRQLEDLKTDNRKLLLLKSGVQSSGNLFSEPEGPMAELDQIVRGGVAEYRTIHQTADCHFIRKWPQNWMIKGWYIRMERGGHLVPHQHQEGWLSGVIYLKLPARTTDEGSIEFSLHHGLPILGKPPANIVYRVSEGDMIVFPSSLFHRTIPFDSDEIRLCIGFDLVPSKTPVEN